MSSQGRRHRQRQGDYPYSPRKEKPRFALISGSIAKKNEGTVFALAVQNSGSRLTPNTSDPKGPSPAEMAQRPGHRISSEVFSFAPIRLTGNALTVDVSTSRGGQTNTSRYQGISLPTSVSAGQVLANTRGSAVVLQPLYECRIMRPQGADANIRSMASALVSSAHAAAQRAATTARTIDRFICRSLSTSHPSSNSCRDRSYSPQTSCQLSCRL